MLDGKIHKVEAIPADVRHRMDADLDEKLKEDLSDRAAMRAAVHLKWVRTSTRIKGRLSNTHALNAS